MISEIENYPPSDSDESFFEGDSLAEEIIKKSDTSKSVKPAGKKKKQSEDDVQDVENEDGTTGKDSSKVKSRSCCRYRFVKTSVSEMKILMK